MKILFQGDSLTDCNRNKEDPTDLGTGYVAATAARLRKFYPDMEFTFINRGVNGDRTRELLKRWQKDTIDLQPDILTLLIGVNDSWRRYDQNDPTPVEEFEANLRTLLEDVKKNTYAKILMIEPFLVDIDPVDLPYPAGADIHSWREDLAPKIQVFRRLAYEYADAYLPMDGILAEMCLQSSPKTWSVDGVHLIPAGIDEMGGYVEDKLIFLIEKMKENAT
ncbi:MAG: SGNH/GDSL hydrolase family protein [Clostridia bacterium]|nr:SGNH/GDSL hydrolase family protein [Clostridia bacterium]